MSTKRKLVDESFKLPVSNPFSSSDYVHCVTLNCAGEGCIPCLYKIFPTGFINGHDLPPNVRPELCARSRKTHDQIEYADLIYRVSDKILTLGDGDLSFSLSLASMLNIFNPCNSTGSQSPIVTATTYESLDVLNSIYPHMTILLEKLDNANVLVRHGVDATKLIDAFPKSEYCGAFDYIVWNFPCVRAPCGADGQVSELEINRNLLRQFFGNCLYLLDCRSTNADEWMGEVHITHKTIEPFSWWNIIEIASDSGFSYCGNIVFDKYLYPGYVNRKALDNKSFPLHDARVILIFLCVYILNF